MPTTSEVFSSNNTILMDILQGRFSTPSGNYFWHRKRQKIKALLQRYVLSTASGNTRTFVDIGCGLGVDLFLIREWLEGWQPGQWQFNGVEIDPTALEVLRLKQEEAQARNISFIPADITKRLPFDDNALDVVYSSEVIEHLSDPDAFIAEVYRVLKKPGGAFLLTTPNEPNIFQRTWWSPARRRQLAAQMEALKAEARSVQTFTAGCENTFIQHHVSLHTVGEWDRLMTSHGFRMDDAERGAMIYGGLDLTDNEWLLGFRFFAEAVLDLFPPHLTRALSDQLITLYLTR